ncbi:hypothetical protein K504DRAFT_508270 [Pleomassaria siparia CBS 279.74]|uniref:DDE-1 domain-containing protein n=1 Tax=Pleomassaria siparia CBS 279.74 TaxID=1314801 RepID=A0A6G1JS35_9PLEO|nr:hypothetical protein K504DRAFT_508270 [Pleomassaria siparia CBS 279.74]
MARWLRAFYKYVGNLEVILLMDNFEAYLSAIELVPPPTDIRIAFLSKNLSGCVFVLANVSRIVDEEA